jgi:hypothetical protein
MRRKKEWEGRKKGKCIIRKKKEENNSHILNTGNYEEDITLLEEE